MLVSSWQDLVKAFPEIAKEDGAEAIKEYLDGGGILKVDENKFRILYPSRRMIDSRIKELRKRRDFFSAQLEKLRQIDSELSPVRLAFDPLFIKHSLKMIADSKYREDFEKLGFTWEHFLDDRTRKIIKAFMENEEYRRNVLEAIDLSPIYKKRKFGSVADVGRSTRRSVVKKKEERLLKTIKSIEKEIAILTVLRKWSI